MALHDSNLFNSQTIYSEGAVLFIILSKHRFLETKVGNSSTSPAWATQQDFASNIKRLGCSSE